ncbi:MvaI/BcnI family restriction endonuclease [Reichenbachiella carrageenanivorans]|uniref:MvaI/BcnI family restriction endonuclease n=1 Tax=Reichenbachiella carrageenanivorans TaxID=2979869 RepID=A0ABY6D0L5_9BACT|nr:MvaI/BcnI family restriction endonuclease [Reichenbachiella carrageenanivorans]UXX78603.1 MvaI/BcnI family restriction endonuclease [Reichenbachiella carrageenanivorans]
MRELNLTEQNNLKVLTENSVSLTLIEPTMTGLKKSIMDATGSVRNYLKSKGVHDYEQQSQGPDHKILIESLLYQDFSIFESRASLYRPTTKKGDPRIWFSGLKSVTSENDILAIISFDQRLHVLNISQLTIDTLISSNLANPVKELISEINRTENTVSQELLNLIGKLAKKGPIPSMLDADTSVGRTLETELGIQINSSREPDYKGIELKAFRANKGNRKNLFAQVPDWKLSKFKSSADILDAFGYTREDDFKLYCTVSAITSNSQGLSLKVNSDINHLIETSDNKRVGDFVVWTLEKLHKRLLEKHKETFWVAADSLIIDGKNHFQYKEIEHTKKPIISQFDILLEQGVITLDHLIKRNSKGRVVEKGPLFKIKPKGLNLLFPPSEKYQLI